jgi:hypothetical protein
MQKVIIIKAGEFNKGEIVLVDNNVAHRLIDSGQGKLYKNKMMVTEAEDDGRRRRS